MARLNRMLLGWSNYFCLGPVSQAYRAVDRHMSPAAPSVVVRQAQGAEAGDTTRFPDQYLHDVAGPGPPERPDREPSVGESVSLVREPDAGNPPVRFDERGVETEQAKPDCGGAAKAKPIIHRETTVTAPVLDSTPHYSAPG